MDVPSTFPLERLADIPARSHHGTMGENLRPKYERIWELRGLPLRGKLMVVGGSTLLWDNAPTAEEFYKSFGFDEVHTMSAFEHQPGSHRHNLNRPLPRELEAQYDVVLCRATIEHVFDVANALRSIAAMVKPGGEVFCDMPANNWLDHGFYQLSPTLLFDFFGVNGFEYLSSRGTLLDERLRIRRAFPLYPTNGYHWNGTRLKLRHVLRTIRLPESTVDRVPKQSRHLDVHHGIRGKYRFEASAPEDESEDGTYTSPPMARFTLSDFRPVDGRWLAPFRNADHLGSLEKLPFRSRGLVYEDRALLKWIVSEPGMVKERSGSFHHDPRAVHFSTSDGSDPRSNGRHYEIAFPDISGWRRG